jgi:hypothetical protein
MRAPPLVLLHVHGRSVAMDTAGLTHEQQRESFYRRRKELEAIFLNTNSFLEQCIVAKEFGELCEEERALLHGRKPISKAEWMD